MKYLYGCAHEQFPPDDLLKQAVEAEEAGFEGISCSDHLQRHRRDASGPAAPPGADRSGMVIISSDPEVHIERIREIEKLGATQIALMNCSGADPHGAIAFHRDSVLPNLR